MITCSFPRPERALSWGLAMVAAVPTPILRGAVTDPSACASQWRLWLCHESLHPAPLHAQPLGCSPFSGVSVKLSGEFEMRFTQESTQYGHFDS